jgi:hypothetical protein
LSARDPTVQVIATRGAKHVIIEYDGDRTRISMCVFTCADGRSFIVVILEGKTERATPLRKQQMACWPEATFVFAPSATQTEETFALCMDKFVEMAGSNNLLVVDGHSSRATLEGMMKMFEHNNDVFSLEAHTSHAAQPFDVAAAKPLRDNSKKHIDLLQLGAPGVPGEPVTQANVLKAIRAAVMDTLAPSFDSKTGKANNVAAKGFEKAGIYPFNPAAVSEKWSAPAKHFESLLPAAAPPASSPDRLAAVGKHTVELDRGRLLQLGKEAVAKRKALVPGATRLTGAQRLQVWVEDDLREQAEEAAKAPGKKRRAAKKAAKLAAAAAEAAAEAEAEATAAEVAASAAAGGEAGAAEPPAKKRKVVKRRKVSVLEAAKVVAAKAKAKKAPKKPSFVRWQERK